MKLLKILTILFSSILILTSCNQDSGCIECRTVLEHNDPFENFNFVDEGKPWFVDCSSPYDSLYFYHLVPYEEFTSKFGELQEEDFTNEYIDNDSRLYYDIRFIWPNGHIDRFTTYTDGGMSNASYTYIGDINFVEVIRYLFIHGESYNYPEDLSKHYISD